MRMKSIGAASTMVLASAALSAGAAEAAPRNPFEGAPAEVGSLPNGGLINSKAVPNLARKTDGEIKDVRPGVWVLQGYSIVNCIVVETDAGLIVTDTGTTRAEGLNFLRLIRSRTDKPILAIIYSHSHYTGGAKAMLEGANNPDVMIIGHSKLEANLQARSLTLHPSTGRRANIQFGIYLPKEGPDAGAGVPSVRAASSEERVPEHVTVNRAVTDGEKMTVGGTEFVFYDAQGDTDDTLTVWLPSLSTVITNVISGHFMAMYTLRGQPFRDPQGIIDSYARIRDLAPDYYVQTHGSPMTGKSLIAQRMQLHRDAYSYTYNQAIRGINQGWSPEEIIERVPLPERFREEPSLIETYSEYEFALRGIYSGLMGWFAEDTSALHPPTPKRLGEAIVSGFGGRAQLVEAARAAQARKEYNLAAVLAGYAVEADPGDMSARQAKADALRAMARVSMASQSHNFYLTEALELEKKIDTQANPTIGFGGYGWQTVAKLPPATLVEVLESRIIPERSAGAHAAFVVDFGDTGSRYRVDIRDAVAEVRCFTDGQGSAIALHVDRRDWFDLMTGRVTLSALTSMGKAKVDGGSARSLQGLLEMFDSL